MAFVMPRSYGVLLLEAFDDFVPQDLERDVFLDGDSL